MGSPKAPDPKYTMFIRALIARDCRSSAGAAPLPGVSASERQALPPLDPDPPKPMGGVVALRARRPRR